MDARLSDVSAAESLISTADGPWGLLDPPLVRDLLDTASGLLSSMPAAATATDVSAFGGGEAKKVGGDGGSASIEKVVLKEDEGHNGSEAVRERERTVAALRRSVLRTRLVKALWELSADTRFAERIAAHPAMKDLLALASRLSAAPADLSVEQLAGYSHALCSAIRINADNNDPSAGEGGASALSGAASQAQTDPLAFADTVQAVGRTHGDTFSFDTWEETFIGAPASAEVQLTRITVWCGEYVNGIQVAGTIRSADGSVQSVESAVRFGGHDDPEPRVVTLAPGEDIERVGLRVGTWIDSITIYFTSGRVERFGDSSSGDPHSLTPPEGVRVVGFLGGFGGHLHNLGLRYIVPSEEEEEEEEAESGGVGGDSAAAMAAGAAAAAAEFAMAEGDLGVLAGPMSAGAELVLRDDFSLFPRDPTDSADSGVGSADTDSAAAMQRIAWRIAEPDSGSGSPLSHAAYSAEDECLLGRTPGRILRVVPRVDPSQNAAAADGAPQPAALRLILKEELPPLFLVAYQLRLCALPVGGSLILPGVAHLRIWPDGRGMWTAFEPVEVRKCWLPDLKIRLRDDWRTIVHIRSEANGPVVTYEDGIEVWRSKPGGPLFQEGCEDPVVSTFEICVPPSEIAFDLRSFMVGELPEVPVSADRPAATKESVTNVRRFQTAPMRCPLSKPSSLSLLAQIPSHSAHLPSLLRRPSSKP